MIYLEIITNNSSEQKQKVNKSKTVTAATGRQTGAEWSTVWAEGHERPWRGNRLKLYF